MADHNKEIDSKFYIFLPHLATSNPVSDIEKGPRFSCFVGELLNFFLIAQFRGKKRTQNEGTELHQWQTRLLSLSISVSVSCVDVTIHKEYDAHATSGFISCSPIRSSSLKSDLNGELSQNQTPLVTNQGDIIYPLNVSLDALPALSRRIKLSVNVWTPELNSDAKVNTQSLWNDCYDIFLYNDPDEILTEVQNTFRCHVNATLPVISPPTVRCKYSSINNKQYVALEVINSLGEPITLHQVNAHPSCSSLSNKPNRLISERSCDTFVMAVNTKHLNQLPLFLLPWEHVSFLFRIIKQDDQTSKDRYFGISLMASVSWSVETLRFRDQKIKTNYSLPLYNISRSSVSVRATCNSIVQKGKRFQVKYTVTNTEDEECNVCLRWQPQYGNMPGMHNLDAESLVCLQPSVRIGCCPPGSSLSVTVEFLAVQEGLHEVGQFMICKWNTGSLNSSPTRSLSPIQKEFEGFTTVSHSCQVFVVVDS